MQNIAIGQRKMIGLIHWYYDAKLADFEMF